MNISFLEFLGRCGESCSSSKRCLQDRKQMEKNGCFPERKTTLQGCRSVRTRHCICCCKSSCCLLHQVRDNVITVKIEILSLKDFYNVTSLSEYLKYANIILENERSQNLDDKSFIHEHSWSLLI